jgi:hypothetical protein
MQRRLLRNQIGISLAVPGMPSVIISVQRAINNPQAPAFAPRKGFFQNLLGLQRQLLGQVTAAQPALITAQRRKDALRKAFGWRRVLVMLEYLTILDLSRELNIPARVIRFRSTNRRTKNSKSTRMPYDSNGFVLSKSNSTIASSAASSSGFVTCARHGAWSKLSRDNPTRMSSRLSQ